MVGHKTTSHTIHYVAIDHQKEYKFVDFEFVEQNQGICIFTFLEKTKFIASELQKKYPQLVFEIQDQKLVNL